MPPAPGGVRPSSWYREASPVLPAYATIEDAAAVMSPGLPGHAAEVMAAHGGQPTIAEQDQTHGAGLPAVDHG